MIRLADYSFIAFLAISTGCAIAASVNGEERDLYHHRWPRELPVQDSCNFTSKSVMCSAPNCGPVMLSVRGDNFFIRSTITMTDSASYTVSAFRLCGNKSEVTLEDVKNNGSQCTTPSNPGLALSLAVEFGGCRDFFSIGGQNDLEVFLFTGSEPECKNQYHILLVNTTSEF